MSFDHPNLVRALHFARIRINPNSAEASLVSCRGRHKHAQRCQQHSACSELAHFQQYIGWTIEASYTVPAESLTASHAVGLPCTGRPGVPLSGMIRPFLHSAWCITEMFVQWHIQ